MAFVDPLAYLLFVLGFVGILTLYMTISVFLSYRKSKKVDMYDTMSGGILPLGALGAYMFIVSLWGQMTWPLPGAYNMLFFDPLISLGMVLMGFAWSIRARVKMHYVGLFSLLAGLMTIFYGITGYHIGLTQSPAAFAMLFMAFGVAGVFAFPVTLIIDLEPGRTSEHPKFWVAMLVLFWLSLIAAILMSFTIGAVAVQGHLLTPP